MWTKPSLQQFARAGQFWNTASKTIILVAMGWAVMLVGLAFALLLIPLVLSAGLALHLYVRRKLRHYGRSSHDGALVIDGDYKVVDRK